MPGCPLQHAPSGRIKHGAVAQLGERLNGIQEVRGSNPLSSTHRQPGWYRGVPFVPERRGGFLFSGNWKLVARSWKLEARSCPFFGTRVRRDRWLSSFQFPVSGSCDHEYQRQTFRTGEHLSAHPARTGRSARAGCGPRPRQAAAAIPRLGGGRDLAHLGTGKWTCFGEVRAFMRWTGRGGAIPRGVRPEGAERFNPAPMVELVLRVMDTLDIVRTDVGGVSWGGLSSLEACAGRARACQQAAVGRRGLPAGGSGGGTLRGGDTAGLSGLGGRGPGHPTLAWEGVGCRPVKLQPAHVPRFDALAAHLHEDAFNEMAVAFLLET